MYKYQYLTTLYIYKSFLGVLSISNTGRSIRYLQKAKVHRRAKIQQLTGSFSLIARTEQRNPTLKEIKKLFRKLSISTYSL